eukprot:m.9980 g.9980  ORF g.9980 m.9980 type:complete len:265 (+) comp3584_c0_seq1:156-950(+)
MFEARLPQAALLKKVLDAVKDLVTDANWDCSQSGISLQAMDTSHVSLVALLMRSDGFEEYRCDRALSLGINIASMSKIMKCADNSDTLTIQAAEEGDSVSFTFETPEQEKVSQFEMKLMDIESEHLGIPNQEHSAVVQLPAAEFQRICRDLSLMGESVEISVTKEGVQFVSSGDAGKGTVTLRNNTSVDDENQQVVITMNEEVKLNFALRYLNFFTKATSLADSVTLSMTADIPLVVEYKIEDIGYIRYYLAPKIDDEDEEDDS